MSRRDAVSSCREAVTSFHDARTSYRDAVTLMMQCRDAVTSCSWRCDVMSSLLILQSEGGFLFEGTQVFGEDENKERGNWTGRADFLLSLLGY